MPELTDLFSPDASGNQPHKTTGEMVREAMARVQAKQKTVPIIETAVEEPVDPAKQGRRKGAIKKRCLAKLDLDAVAAEMDLGGHHYGNPATVVLLTPSLSGMAKAIYWYLDTRCFDGKKGPDGWIDQPSYKCRVGQSEIEEMFAISDDAVRGYIKELRDHGFVGQTRRGAHKRNEYSLIPRKIRLEWQTPKK